MDRDFEGAWARAEQLAQRAQQQQQQGAHLQDGEVVVERGDGWQRYRREHAYEDRAAGGSSWLHALLCFPFLTFPLRSAPVRPCSWLHAFLTSFSVGLVLRKGYCGLARSRALAALCVPPHPGRPPPAPATGGGFSRGYYSESVVVWGPTPAGASQLPAHHAGLLPGLGLLVAAFLAGKCCGAQPSRCVLWPCPAPPAVVALLPRAACVQPHFQRLCGTCAWPSPSPPTHPPTPTTPGLLQAPGRPRQPPSAGGTT